MVEFFDGSVGEAIKSVQERNRCLLVTVQDDSNACEEMETRLWTDSSVVEAISEAEFTCLMIKADTQDYVYFGSFFPVYVFPTVYILAPNGKPLAYFATSVPKSELLVKVQESASKLQEESSSKKRAEKDIRDKCWTNWNPKTSSERGGKHRSRYREIQSNTRFRPVSSCGTNR
uniref:Thioredoxin-like fold domain-containing protein n=1 Tax=Rhodosorus marinus TaxID=101924 RepID=A0A7S2ZVP1_9RHOD|mmetsp:Transcript_31253/g.120366  ORF Transcript_31253/g.120366 Transcript_31253/m.120366 type:complete len:174 (+) Transcript_31253:395-916(+)